MPIVALALMLLAAAEPAAPYDDQFGAWSPDGGKIAFMSTRSGDPEIYVANADGSGVTRLTDTPGRDAHPAWTPDGKSILFQSPREGGQVRLFEMNADGTNQRSLSPTTGFCGVPLLSPNAAKIVFQCSASMEKIGTPEAPWRIYMLKRGGTEPRLISQGPGNDQVPNWSPDGSRLLFFSDRGGTNQLYEMTLKSGEIVQLTNGPAAWQVGQYSPDGSRIAAVRIEGDRKDIVIGDGKGGWRTLASLRSAFTGPVFSPDGKTIMFADETDAGVRLFVLPSDGSAEPKLVDMR